MRRNMLQPSYQQYNHIDNMPLGGSPVYVIGQLNFTDSCDEAEVEISVTVPSNEPTGAKTSGVTFTGST